MAGEWNQTTLGSIAAKDGYGLVDGPFGSNLPASCYVANGVPVIRGSNLTLGTSRFVADEFVFVSRETAERLARSLCRPLDVVFTKKGTLGQTGLVPEHGPYDLYLVSSNQMKLTVDRRLADPGFVYYFVSSPTSTGKIIRDSEATGVPKINVAYLRDFPITLPPLSEQRAIAHILGTLDDKIELNRRMNETLEAMARALFKSWFVDFDPVRAKAERRDTGLPREIADLFPNGFEESELGEIPRGWELGKLSDLVTNIVDRVQPSQATEAIPYVPIECISPRTICLSDAQPGSNAHSSLVRFQQGDILLGAMRPYFHKVCIAPFAGTTRTTVFILRPDPCELGYTALVVSRDETIDFATAHSEGSTIPCAKWTNSLDSLGIVLPPRRLRQEFYQSILPTISRMMASVIESRTLAALRDTLLPKLISGQVRVGDAARFVGAAASVNE